MYKVVRCANVEYGLVNGSTYFRTIQYWFNAGSKLLNLYMTTSRIPLTLNLKKKPNRGMMENYK